MLLKKNMFILLSIFVMGCEAQNPVITDPNSTNQNNSNTQNQTNTQTTGSLKFNKISEANKALQNNSQAKTVANPNSSRNSDLATPALAPSLGKAEMGAAPSDAMVSSRMMMPRPSGFQEYVMISNEEASSDGFVGTYLETYKKIVKPLLSELDTNANLKWSNGGAGNDGKNPVSNEMNSYQWQFSYVSNDKKEVYDFYISDKKTLVLKQKWAIKNLNPDDVKIDSSKAISILKEKIADKNYKSPDPNNQNYIEPNSEAIYTLPEKTGFSFYLAQEESNLVWNINMSVNTQPYYYSDVPMREVMSNSYVPEKRVENIWYSGGSARINAKTGEVLSFYRPMKHSDKFYQPYMSSPPSVGQPDMSIMESN